jgi:hypothetical protein
MSEPWFYACTTISSYFARLRDTRQETAAENTASVTRSWLAMPGQLHQYIQGYLQSIIP